ncbi:MAG: hypothetical protein IJK26_09615 [Clostridia bacterium]|nr:hypothetical protein [Clostridia bacterium]
MSYIPNNHEAALLPETGVFRLKVPLKCQNGTFEAGTTVELEQLICEKVVQYKVTGAGENGLVEDLLGFNAHTDNLRLAWDNTFEPVTVTDYEEKINAFKKADEKAGFITVLIGIVLFGFGLTTPAYALLAFMTSEPKDWQALWQVLGLTAASILLLCLLLYVYDRKDKKIKKDLTDYKLSFLKECA